LATTPSSTLLHCFPSSQKDIFVVVDQFVVRHRKPLLYRARTRPPSVRARYVRVLASGLTARLFVSVRARSFSVPRSAATIDTQLGADAEADAQ